MTIKAKETSLQEPSATATAGQEAEEATTIKKDEESVVDLDAASLTVTSTTASATSGGISVVPKRGSADIRNIKRLLAGQEEEGVLLTPAFTKEDEDEAANIAAKEGHPGSQQTTAGLVSRDYEKTAKHESDIGLGVPVEKDPRDAIVDQALAFDSQAFQHGDAAAASNSNYVQGSADLEAASPEDFPKGPDAPVLSRQTATRPRAPAEPGAVAIGPVAGGNGGGNDFELTEEEQQMQAQNSQEDPEDPPSAGLNPEEHLVNATLVQEQSSHLLVEAQPSLEGFKAIVHNRKFKYLMAFIILVFLAVVVPIVVVIPKKNSGGDSVTAAEVLATSCGTAALNQTEYRGNISMTEDGRACFPWNSDFPDMLKTYFKESGFDLNDYPDAGLESNYCRNPGSFRKKAWCIADAGTLGSHMVDECDVPYCEGTAPEEGNVVCGSEETKQANYRGAIATTASGRTCQRW